MKKVVEHTPDEVRRNRLAKEEIRKCFINLGFLSEEEVNAALTLISIKNYKKGDLLIRKGGVSPKSYSIISGCVRQFYLVDGEEKTTFFYTEQQSIFLPNNNAERVPVKYYLSCVEDTTVSVITLENQNELYQRFPKLESMSRNSLIEELNNYQEMLASYITSNPEERYLNLLKFRPELLNRVPQYQLASYLGVTPESLSRIRKRIFLK